MREESAEFEVKDSWLDFVRYDLGMDESADDMNREEDEATSFSKVMARMTSTEPAGVESDEENEHSEATKKNIFLSFIPNWVIRSN